MVLAHLSGQPADAFATGPVARIDPRLRLGPNRNAAPTGRFVLLWGTIQVLFSECRLALHAPGVFWKPFLSSKCRVTGVWVQRSALEPELRILVLHLVPGADDCRGILGGSSQPPRSEERRVGKECRS